LHGAATEARARRGFRCNPAAPVEASSAAPPASHPAPVPASIRIRSGRCSGPAAATDARSPPAQPPAQHCPQLAPLRHHRGRITRWTPPAASPYPIEQAGWAVRRPVFPARCGPGLRHGAGGGKTLRWDSPGVSQLSGDSPPVPLL